jgi:hypothetical protein
LGCQNKFKSIHLNDSDYRYLSEQGLDVKNQGNNPQGEHLLHQPLPMPVAYD